MIRNYGLDWDRGVAVRNMALLGRDKLGLEIDLSDQIGLYVLKKGDEIVYVGRAGTDGTDGTIAARLYDHYKSMEKHRMWNGFCWFGVYDVDRSVRQLAYNPLVRMRAGALISDVETLLIYLLAPKLNEVGGKYKHMTEFMQVGQAKRR